MFTAALWLQRRDPAYLWFTAATLAWALLHLALPALETRPSPLLSIAFFGLWAFLQLRFLVALQAYGDRAIAALPFLLGFAIAASALHDGVRFDGSWSFGPGYLLPWAAALTLVAASGVLLRRFVLAMRESEAQVATLELRVRQKRDELEAALRQLREAERARVIADERERIMREMHDGLGSHLVSTLSLIECNAGREATAAALRTTLEDLRVMIDSLAPVEADLVTALAMLRSRLQPRLEAAGLSVEWSVGELPPAPAIGPHSVMQVLRIVQEALTNVVKHAGARSVAIRSATHERTIVVEVCDDGDGTPAARHSASTAPGSQAAASLHSPRGRGIDSMRKRAAELGGRVDLHASPEGTTLRLSIPVAGRSAAGEVAA